MYLDVLTEIAKGKKLGIHSAWIQEETVQERHRNILR